MLLLGYVHKASATQPYTICHHTPSNQVTLTFQNYQSYFGHLGTPHSGQTYDTNGACVTPTVTVTPSITSVPSVTASPTATLTEEKHEVVPTDKPLDWDNRKNDPNNCLNKSCNPVDTHGNTVVLSPAPFSK